MGEWANRFIDEDAEVEAVVRVEAQTEGKDETEDEGLLAKDMSLSIFEHSLEQ